jgi:hypothetical protein
MTDRTVAGAQRTVLIVDDDPSFTSQLQSWLLASGYDVLTAQTAADARRMWSPRRHPTVHAAVVDLNSPDMSGIELIRQIAIGRHNNEDSGNHVTDQRPAPRDCWVCRRACDGSKFEPDSDEFPGHAWVDAVSAETAR